MLQILKFGSQGGNRLLMGTLDWHSIVGDRDAQ